MNSINFNHTGGFPLETDLMTTLQSIGITANQALCALVGEDRFLKPLETISPGVIGANLIMLNGEILNFIESTAADPGNMDDNYVGIVEEITTREFEDLSTKNVITKRFAHFGTSAIYQKKFGELQGFANTIHKLSKVLSVFIPGGGMVLWNKPVEDIPSGWA